MTASVGESARLGEGKRQRITGTTSVWWRKFDTTVLFEFMFMKIRSPWCRSCSLSTGSIDSEPASGKRYFIFTNQIGVPIRVEDNHGESCWSARVDPYGVAHVDPGSTIEMSLRFPGHYHDPETGLHYNRFRYFSPELGRFLQSDPAGLEGGINVYAYPDPLTDADIDGLAKAATGVKSPPSGKKAKGTAAGAEAGCPHEEGAESSEGEKRPPHAMTAQVIRDGEPVGDPKGTRAEERKERRINRRRWRLTLKEKRSRNLGQHSSPVIRS